MTFQLDWGKGPFPRSARREQLYRAFLDDPRNAENRNVYVDLCAEEGDPHGELVRLGAMLREKEDEHVEAWGRVLEAEPAVGAIRDAMDQLRARYGRSFYEPFLRSAHFGRSRWIEDPHGYVSGAGFDDPYGNEDRDEVGDAITFLSRHGSLETLTSHTAISSQALSSQRAQLRRADVVLISNADVARFEDAVFDSLESLSLSISNNVKRSKQWRRVPRRVMQLKRLKHLSLKYIHREFIEAVAQLPIRSLTLREPHSDLPFGHHAFPLLRALSFSCNGTRPKRLLKRIPSLTSLRLWGERRDRARVVDAVAQSDLVHLSLNVDAALTPALLSSPMRELRDLELNIQDAFPTIPESAELPRLQRLIVRGRHAIVTPESFANLPDATEVDLKHPLTPRDLQSMSGSALLTRVTALEFDYRTSAEEIEGALGHTTQLTKLIGGDTTLSALSRSELPHLRTLDLQFESARGFEFASATQRSSERWRYLILTSPSDEMLKTLIDSTALSELGGLSVHDRSDTPLRESLERRYGHRVRINDEQVAGPVTLDPCNDPWFDS